MTDLRLKEDTGRGNQAQLILDNPLFVEALIMMRGELIAKFEQTKFRDKEERDEIWRKLQTVGWFESYLTRIMQTGKLAEQTMLQKAKTRFTR